MPSREVAAPELPPAPPPAYGASVMEGIQALREMQLPRPSTLTQEDWDRIARDPRLAEIMRQAWGLETPPGYAPDSGLGLEQILGNLFSSLPQEFTLEELYQLAESSDPEVSRSAQALLANPNFLNALDVADGGRADGKFTQQGLVNAFNTEVAADDGLLGAEEVAEVLSDEKVFGALDIDGNGNLTRQELAFAERHLDMFPQQTQKVIQALLGNQNTFNALDVGMGNRTNGGISSDNVRDVAWGPTQPSDNVWTPRDDIALDAALRQEGTFGDELFTAFDQGSRGNCASIAVVKAAMDRFGNDVFQNVERSPDGGYRVTMQDGYVVELTREELDAAAQASDFTGRDPEACAYATLCFAAMAKRAQMTGHDGADTYAEALWSLTTGEQTAQVPELLGLQDHVRRISRDEVGDYSSGVVGYGNGHAVYIDTVNGETYVDLWSKDKNGLIPLEELDQRTDWEGPENYFVFI